MDRQLHLDHRRRLCAPPAPQPKLSPKLRRGAPPDAAAPAPAREQKIRTIELDKKTIKLQIWDTAGQERFRSMAPLYYRGAVAAILVFAVTDESSFDKLKDWVRELQSNIDEPLVLAIACNKADLAEQRAVSFETAAQYAATIGALVYETSAKSSTGVDELFNEVARRLVVTRARATETGQPQLPDPLQDAPKSGCC